MKALVAALAIMIPSLVLAQGVSVISNPVAPAPAAARLPAPGQQQQLQQQQQQQQQLQQQQPMQPQAQQPTLGNPNLGGAVDPQAAAADPSLQVAVEQAAYQQKISELNAHNPMSADFGGPASGGDPANASAGSPAPEMLKMLENPTVQRYLRAFRTPAASQMMTNAQVVLAHPNRPTLLYAELGLFVFMMFFRAWRNGRAQGLIQRLWVSVSSTALFVFCSSVALPYLIIGPQYFDMLKNLVQMWSQSAA